MPSNKLTIEEIRAVNLGVTDALERHHYPDLPEIHEARERFCRTLDRADRYGRGTLKRHNMLKAAIERFQRAVEKSRRIALV